MYSITFILKPCDFNKSIAFSVANTPALSLSKHSKTLFEYFFNSLACSNVKAVPNGATQVSKL